MMERACKESPERGRGGSVIIEVQDVDKSYRVGDLEVPILKGACLQVREGSLTVVFGVSGTGKTTLLNLIGGLDRPDAGRISVDGHETTSMSESGLTEFRRRTLGFVFQFYNLLPTLTALENVESAVELVSRDRSEIRRRARDYLEKVGLGPKADTFPDQLSGGEQQRVAIARALAKHPRVLLADEPTGNLDEETGLQIARLFQDINRTSGTTMIIVTHNPRIREIADQVVSIEKGKIVERVFP